MKALGCVFRCALWLIPISLVALCVLFGIGAMWQSGIWPFQPLEADHREIKLANGGTVLIDGKEQWGELNGNGLLNYTCGYRPPGSTTVEDLGEMGRFSTDGEGQFNPRFDLVGSRVVFAGNKTLYVRALPGEWGCLTICRGFRQRKNLPMVQR